MAHTEKITCPDCGNAPTNHTVSKLIILVDWTLSSVTSMFNRLWRVFERLTGPFIYNTLTPAIYRVFAKARLGTIVHAPDDKTSSRSLCLWQEAKRRDIDMWEFRLFGLSRELFVAKWPNRKGGREISFDGLPMPVGTSPAALSWMDDKGKLHERFGKVGIPMAEGGAVSNLTEAKNTFEKLRKPVITKPNIGSRSRHTTTHIKDLATLESAYKSAKQLSPWVIVEEELLGVVYRATVIGGEVIGVLRKDLPQVEGDGTRTMRELIDIENSKPARRGPIFHGTPESPELDAELQRQGLTQASIPLKGDLVFLSQKTSRGLGGGATDVTDTTHPNNNALFEQVARELDYPVVGIDFIIGDISRSWKEQPRSGLIECNSMPFIDVHVFPLAGKPRNTPGALWELIFPRTTT